MSLPVNTPQPQQPNQINQKPLSLLNLESISDPILRQNLDAVFRQMLALQQRNQFAQTNTVYGNGVSGNTNGSTPITDTSTSIQKPGGLQVQITSKGGPIRLKLAGFNNKVTDDKSTYYGPIYKIAINGNYNSIGHYAGWIRTGNGASKQISQNFIGQDNTASVNPNGIYVFNFSSNFSFTVGDIYQDSNGNTFQVISSVTTLPIMFAWGSVAPTAFVSLTRTSGSGSSPVVPSSVASIATSSSQLSALSNSIHLPAFEFDDLQVGAGTYTYQFYYQNQTGTQLVYNQLQVIAEELRG